MQSFNKSSNSSVITVSNKKIDYNTLPEDISEENYDEPISSQTVPVRLTADGHVYSSDKRKIARQVRDNPAIASTELIHGIRLNYRNTPTPEPVDYNTSIKHVHVGGATNMYKTHQFSRNTKPLSKVIICKNNKWLAPAYVKPTIPTNNIKADIIKPSVSNRPNYQPSRGIIKGDKIPSNPLPAFKPKEQKKITQTRIIEDRQRAKSQIEDLFGWNEYQNDSNMSYDDEFWVEKPDPVGYKAFLKTDTKPISIVKKQLIVDDDGPDSPPQKFSNYKFVPVSQPIEEELRSLTPESPLSVVTPLWTKESQIVNVQTKDPIEYKFATKSYIPSEQLLLASDEPQNVYPIVHLPKIEEVPYHRVNIEEALFSDDETFIAQSLDHQGRLFSRSSSPVHIRPEKPTSVLKALKDTVINVSELVKDKGKLDTTMFNINHTAETITKFTSTGQNIAKNVNETLVEPTIEFIKRLKADPHKAVTEHCGIHLAKYGVRAIVILTNWTEFVYDIIDIDSLPILITKFFNKLITTMCLLEIDTYVFDFIGRKTKTEEPVAQSFSLSVSEFLKNRGFKNDILTIGKFATAFNAMCKAADNVTTFIDWIINSCPDFIFKIFKFLTKPASREFQDNAHQLLDMHKIMMDSLLSNVRINSRRYEDYVALKSKFKESMLISTKYNRPYYNMYKMILAEEHSIDHYYTTFDVLKRRRTPFCICFRGAPGCGKSTFVNFLVEASAAMTKHDIRKPTRYDKNIQDEFWPRYQQGTYSVVLDEFMQNLEVNDASMLTVLVSSAPYVLNQAALNDKGQLFDAKAIFVITNTYNEDSAGAKLFDIKALKRRFFLDVTVTQKEGIDYAPDFSHLTWTITQNVYDKITTNIELNTLDEFMEYYSEALLAHERSEDIVAASPIVTQNLMTKYSEIHRAKFVSQGWQDCKTQLLTSYYETKGQFDELYMHIHDKIKTFFSNPDNIFLTAIGIGLPVMTLLGVVLTTLYFYFGAKKVHKAVAEENMSQATHVTCKTISKLCGTQYDCDIAVTTSAALWMAENATMSEEQMLMIGVKRLLDLRAKQIDVKTIDRFLSKHQPYLEQFYGESLTEKQARPHRSRNVMHGLADDILNHDKLNTPVTHRLNRQIIAQGMIDQVAEDIKNSISDNLSCTALYAVTKDGGYLVNYVNTIHIQNRKYLYPRHFFLDRDGEVRSNTNDLKYTLHMKLKVKDVWKTFNVPYNPDNIMRVKTASGALTEDAVLYDFKDSLRLDQPQNIQRFILQKDLDVINDGTQCNMISLSLRNDVLDKAVRSFPVSMLKECIKYEVSSKTSLYLVKGLSYETDTSVGDCGSIIVHKNPNTTRKLLGMHLFGSVTSYKAGALIITQEMLKATLGDEQPEVLYDPPVTFKRCAFDHNTSNTAQELMNVAECLSMDFVGELKNPVYINRATDFVSTEFNEDYEFSKITKTPSIKVGDPDPALISTFMFGSDIIEAEVPQKQQLLDYVVSKYDDDDAKILSDIEALNKFGRMDAMNLHTSSGYPYVTTGQNKHHFITNTDGDLSFTPLGQNIMNVESKGWEDVKPVVFVTALKDNLEKSGKMCRIFEIPPWWFSVLTRMYFGAFISMFHKANTRMFSCIGINPESQQWNDLIFQLLKISSYGIDCDVSAYDKNLLEYIMLLGVETINMWYRKNDRSWKRIHDTIRKNIVLAMIHCYMITGKWLFRTHKGMKSGFVLTAILNTICNMIMTLIWFYICVPLSHRDYSKFDQIIVCKFYGDDDIEAIREDMLQWLNRISRDKVYQSRFSMYLTAADKSSTLSPFNRVIDLQFLKRKIRYTSRGYVPLLDHVSIASMLCYVRKSKLTSIDEQLEVNLDVACKFMYFYGLLPFRKFIVRVNQVRPGLYPSYEYYDSLFYDAGFLDCGFQ